jgi:hypothetical protein
MSRVNRASGSERPAKNIGNGRAWLTPVGIGLLLIGVIASFLASRRQGHDFACVYFTAVGLVEDLPIYDFGWQKLAFPSRLGIGVPQGMFYPPATGVGVLPLGLLPYPAAHVAWFVLLCGVLVLGIRALVLLARPDQGARQWPLVAGLVLLSAAVRWGMTPQQGAPLILGVLGLFALALYEGSFVVALLLAAFAVSFKTTLSLPFLGLLFLYRRYASAAFAVASMVLLNVLGFARLGGMSTWKAYQTNVAGLEALHDINTPDPWDLASVPRLDWIYLFHGIIRNVPVARLAALACAGLVGLWLLWQAYKVRTPTLASTGAFMLAFACLTNLSVYHHHYDVSLVIAPLLVLGLGVVDWRKPPLTVWLTLPLLAIMALLPVAMLQRLVVAHFGAVGRGLLNLSFPLTVTLTLIAALVTIQRLVAALPSGHVSARGGSMPADAVLEPAERPLAER